MCRAFGTFGAAFSYARLYLGELAPHLSDPCVQAPLIDSLLSDIGIEGGSLAKQGGLIREASDMQRIADAAKKGGAEGGKK